jgi:hypothetical protein
LQRLFLRSRNFFFGLMIAVPAFASDLPNSVHDQLRNYFEDQLGVTLGDSLELKARELIGTSTNGVLETELGFIMLGSGHVCRYGTGHRYMQRFQQTGKGQRSEGRPDMVIVAECLPVGMEGITLSLDRIFEMAKDRMKIQFLDQANLRRALESHTSGRKIKNVMILTSHFDFKAGTLFAFGDPIHSSHKTTTTTPRASFIGDFEIEFMDGTKKGAHLNQDIFRLDVDLLKSQKCEGELAKWLSPMKPIKAVIAPLHEKWRQNPIQPKLRSDFSWEKTP